MPSIAVKSRDGNTIHPLQEGKPVFIGRAQECDIVLASAAVSRRHAVIIYKNGICGIKDLGSFNGTLVNGEAIVTPRHLTERDAVAIASFAIRIFLDAPAPPPPGDEPEAETPPDPAMRAPSRSGRGLPIPRAMQKVERDVDAIIDAIETNPVRSDVASDATHDYLPGNDTVHFLRDEMPGIPDVMAKKTASDIPAPEQTAPDAASAPENTPPEPDPDTGDTTAPLPDGETIIPLADDAESLPTLLLDEEEPPGAVSGESQADIPQPFPASATASGSDPYPDEMEPRKDDAPTPEPGDAEPSEPYFNPDTGEYDPVADAPRPSSATATPGLSIPASLSPGPAPEGLRLVDISPDFMAAIVARLSLHARLLELSAERALFRDSHPALTRDLLEELDRQDAETAAPPGGGEAERKIAALRALWAERANEDGGAASDEESALRDLALAQWTLIRDSDLEALPAVHREAYRLAADEPLARELSAERIPHGGLMGGAMYLLALEALLAASRESSRVSGRLHRLASGEPENAPSGFLGKLGRFANALRNRGAIREEAERLEKECEDHAKLADLALRESKLVHKALNRDFHAVYRRVALHFIVPGLALPPGVRAFLRHGVLGFKPWWMPEAVRRFIIEDCDDILAADFDQRRDGPFILHADEYLSAVARMECSPSPDESLTGLGGHAPEVKTDRAYRRIVNARVYNLLMQDMLEELGRRAEELDVREAALEHKIAELEGRKTAKNTLYELQTEHQTIAIRKANLRKHMGRIEARVVPSIIEAVQDAERRFRTRELVMPTPERLVEREVAFILDSFRRHEIRRGQCLPMAVREFFRLDGDPVNTRTALRKDLADLEKLDPGIFTSVIVQAKKKINRIELRLPPTVLILPGVGGEGFCGLPREGMEGGLLALPACFNREGVRKRLYIQLLADFRWQTSRKMAGRDAMHSDTLAGAFMRLRWEWRNFPKSKREKGMIHIDLNDAGNWRRVYDLYISDAMDGARQLFLRNPECYFSLIGKHIDLPDGVPPHRHNESAAPE